MRTPETPAPSPAGLLIRRSRLASRLTPEEAAARAGVIRGGRWTQIERGWVSRGGERKPTAAEDDVLAHMAYVVSVEPEQLDEIDCHEAAEILRQIIRLRAAAVPRRERKYADPVLEYLWQAPEALPDNLRELFIRTARNGGNAADSVADSASIATASSSIASAASARRR
jgi:hypothetical protein